MTKGNPGDGELSHNLVADKELTPERTPMGRPVAQSRATGLPRGMQNRHLPLSNCLKQGWATYHLSAFLFPCQVAAEKITSYIATRYCGPHIHYSIHMNGALYTVPRPGQDVCVPILFVQDKGSMCYITMDLSLGYLIQYSVSFFF